VEGGEERGLVESEPAAECRPGSALPRPAALVLDTTRRQTEQEGALTSCLRDDGRRLDREAGFGTPPAGTEITVQHGD
jgi:hypothetical protein